MTRKDSVVFDKDDADTLDFVCAAANLRATIFGIANESRFTIKGRLVDSLRVCINKMDVWVDGGHTHMCLFSCSHGGQYYSSHCYHQCCYCRIGYH